MSLAEATEAATRPTTGEAPASAGFLSGFALAYIGAFVAVAPLLQILAPLRAGIIDPEARGQVLSLAVFFGALAAGAANVVAGGLSDRTASRYGRRRPWIVAGALATAASYGLIYSARTTLELILGLVVFQILFNVMFASLLALFADRVPGSRKGVISAIVGMGFPLASMIGAVLIGAVFRSEAVRFLLLGGVLVASVVPFALMSRDPPVRRRPALVRRPQIRPGLGWLRPFADRDFSLAWSGRFLMTAGFSLVGIYLLYFVAEGSGYERQFPGRAPEAGLSLLTTLSFAGVIVVSLLIAAGARWLRRRKPFAAVGSACLAAAMTILANAQEWGPVLWAFGLYGVGMGFYFAIELALITDVLPSAADRGRDLGLINLSATLPQAFAPLLALGLIEGLGVGFPGLFLTAAGLFLAAAGCLLTIRSIS